MTITGTPYFVNFTKACDYYKDAGYDDMSPAELDRVVRQKIDDGEVYIDKPEIQPGERLLLIDNGTRYAIKRAGEGGA